MKISMDGIDEIRAFMTSDGKKYFELSKAERRQKILNAKDQPCNNCDCSGKVFIDIPGAIGGYEDVCPNCDGHGFLRMKFVKLDKK